MSKFAMAHAMKKRAKKMADGGLADQYASFDSDMANSKVDPSDDDSSTQSPIKGKFANGGFVHEEEESGFEAMPEEHEKDNHAADKEDDIVMRIMKAHKKMYSEGGEVANDVGVAEADKLPAEYDDLVLRDDDMEDADYTGKNSGDEHGNKGEDERRSDIVSRIMKSRAKKDRMPNPA